LLEFVILVRIYPIGIAKMLFLCIFSLERLGLLIEEDEQSPSILSERFVLTGSNRYAPDERAYGHREPRPGAGWDVVAVWHITGASCPQSAVSR
jgi:hypothetical protein